MPQKSERWLLALASKSSDVPRIYEMNLQGQSQFNAAICKLNNFLCNFAVIFIVLHDSYLQCLLLGAGAKEGLFFYFQLNFSYYWTSKFPVSWAF